MPRQFYSCRITLPLFSQTLSRPPCWWFWAHIMTSNWKQWRPTMPSCDLICQALSTDAISTQLCQTFQSTTNEMHMRTQWIHVDITGDTPFISSDLMIFKCWQEYCIIPHSHNYLAPSVLFSYFSGELLLIQSTFESQFNSNQSWYLIICVLKSQENLEQ